MICSTDDLGIFTHSCNLELSGVDLLFFSGDLLFIDVEESLYVSPSITTSKVLVDGAVFLAPRMLLRTVVQRRFRFTNILFPATRAGIFVNHERIAHEWYFVFVGGEET